MLADIETLNKEKELGLLTEDGQERLNNLKEQYQSLDESAVRREINRRKIAENKYLDQFIWLVIITLLA